MQIAPALGAKQIVARYKSRTGNANCGQNEIERITQAGSPKAKQRFEHLCRKRKSLDCKSKMHIRESAMR